MTLIDWGAGILQKNITLYHLSQNRLTCILDEPKIAHFGVTSQQSRFELRRSTESRFPGNQYLHEEQEITMETIVLSRSRNWVWEEGLQHMRCVAATSEEHSRKAK